MRRPPGLWILLSAGVLWLSLQDVYGIRATALIFAKTTTTTTEASVSPSGDGAASADDVSSTEPSQESTNVTGPTLTGNPQIDYKFDPNLPQELNGFNLSDYPFYERVPDEEFDFKCDGLHDGFYASVPHKCQVYHHCLFGTRYDFLCANYTAFDQKTFICQFASVVDCANSKKYWHRNDALYQAASTTTAKPLVIHTTPAVEPQTPISGGQRRPGAGGRRRPTRRRRPQYDYYDEDYYEDDYYVERPRNDRRRKRPRPRPRPVYEEDYEEEYEDEDRMDRRGGNRRDNRKRPYDNRRGAEEERRRKNKDRRKYEYEDDEDKRHSEEEEDDRTQSRRDGDKRKSDEDRSTTTTTEKRRPYEHAKRKKPEPNPTSSEETNDRRSNERRRPQSQSSREEEDDYDTKPIRKSQQRRPQEYEDDDRSYERPRKDERRKTTEAPRAIIKPVSGTIYDRPRVAPKIKLPVPKNEADKYAYKPIGVKSTAAPLDEEYYDDYEEEPLPVTPVKSNKKPKEPQQEKLIEPEESKDTRKYASSASRLRSQSAKKPAKDSTTTTTSTTTTSTTTKRPKFANRFTNRKKPAVVEEYDDEEYVEELPKAKKNGPKTDKTTTTSTTTTTTTTTTTQQPPQEPIVRIVKRPFLPSRGGNPFSARGLQPVGTKAQEKPVKYLGEEEPESVEPLPKEPLQKEPLQKEPLQILDPKPAIDEQLEDKKPYFKASPVILKVPRQKYPILEEDYNRQQDFRPYQTTGPRTTQKPKLANPLDLNEYDVTLNDALNPTLPNLPIRGYPSGFSPATDYTFSSFQRPRYVADPAISSSNSEYTFQIKPARLTRYEGPSSTSTNRGEQFSIGNNGDFNNFRPRQQQQQQHTYYTTY